MTDGPRIHCICVVKNEGDIMEMCLREASRWAAHVIVYDGESTDGTWEIAQRLKSEQIIPWKQDGKVFQESLRAEVFNEFRHLAKDGDWWCHLDADEFFVQDPRQFLTQVPRRYHVVWGIAVEYYLTRPDLARIDMKAPVDQIVPQLRHYTIENAEPRFFRHRERLQWRIDQGWPAHMGLTYPQRIFFKHFKYRTPEQIQRRLDTRRRNVERGFPGWQHARSATWESTIADPARLAVDRGDGKWQVNLDRLPDHLGTLESRLFKRFMHGTGIWP